MPNRKRRILLPFLLLTTILIITATSCNMFNEPERNPNRTLNLTVEDVSCTEAWIKLNETNAELPASVKLYANDTLKQTLELTSADTLIYDEGLLPNRAYAYRAELIKPQKPTLKSQTVTATTLDTTSHDFTWETFTFGGANGSSYLRDVAIINENDIWAVGEIHTEDDFDSLGHYQPYNAVHWNGQEWELKRVMFYIDPDQPWAGKTSSPCETSFVFGDNNFAITSNVQIAIFDESGNYQILKMGFPWEERFTINAMWGTSRSDFYVVGNNGNIAHYDGSSWEKIESGTTSNIHEVWGIKKNNGEGNTYFAVSNAMLVIDDNNSMTKIDVEQNMILLSLWGKTNNLIYTAGNGVVLYKNKKWERINNNYVDKIYEIKGRDYNDIYGIAYGNVLIYYNGYNWENINTNTDNKFWNLSVGSKVIVAVGYLFEKGLITIFRK